MRHLCAAIAAWTILLVSVPAGAVTPWNTDAAFPAALDIGTAAVHQVEPGESVFWRPEDTAASPLILVPNGGATIVWDDGAATEDLTIEQATGDMTTTGAWKTYGPPLDAAGTCETLDACSIRHLLPGIYRFDTTGAAVGGQLKVTGEK